MILQFSTTRSAVTGESFHKTDGISKGTLSSLNALLTNQRSYWKTPNFPSHHVLLCRREEMQREGQDLLVDPTENTLGHFSTPETLRTQPVLLVGDKISFIMNIKMAIFILQFSPT